MVVVLDLVDVSLVFVLVVVLVAVVKLVDGFLGINENDPEAGEGLRGREGS